MRLGIVGMGKVGITIYKVLNMFHEEVRGFDNDPKKSRNTLEEILEMETIFLCLPTPEGSNGRLDVSLIMEYLRNFENKKYSGLIIIKSTLPLGFFKSARKLDLRILYVPEFLHEKTAIQEFVNPEYIICSGNEEDYLELMNIIYWVDPRKFFKMGDRTAEITKLAMNAFAATKISFVNEVERICRIHQADVEKVFEILRMDKRCGSEYATPKRGPYGGSCLVKDINELKNSIPNTWLLQAVEKVNERVKQEMKYK